MLGFLSALIVAAVLAGAALAVSLMHMGPAGPQGSPGVPGTQGLPGATGPAGPAAYDPYGYICTVTNVPGFTSGLVTAYYPCSDKNPNG